MVYVLKQTSNEVLKTNRKYLCSNEILAVLVLALILQIRVTYCSYMSECQSTNSDKEWLTVGQGHPT